MRLLSLAVRHFKGLESEELRDLAPDLNLVVGPNESGKSRLAWALRCALFERYKGESEDKRALRTYGSSDAPYVEVHFEARGTAWSLRKQFLRQAYAKLEGGGRTWADDDAEAMLRDLFGTRPIQGRRDIEQFLGLWPLLWVRQGEAVLAPQTHLNDDARARLRDVLASQVNEVAAGPMGERIVGRAERERDRYWTATGRETGELAAARTRDGESEAALAQAVAKRAAAHAEADELEAIGRDLEALDARIAPQRARVAEAEARVARARDLAAKHKAHEADAARRRAETELAERALAERGAAAERHAALAARMADERAALEPRVQARLELEARAAEAEARVEVGHVALEQAHTENLRARRYVHQAEAARREREARERLERAKGHLARVLELRAKLGEARIDEAQIRALRRSGEALAKAEAALAAASASVKLHAARDLVVDGAALGEGQERAWSAHAPLRFVIEGVGAVEVRPGGVDLDAQRAKEQQVRHALAADLERLGATSLADAEERFARRTAFAAQLAQAEPLLAEAAPEGVASLEEDLRARTHERAALGDVDPGAPSIGDADARLAAATEATSRARAARDALRAEIARAQEAIARHEASIAAHARDHAEATARLGALPAPEVLSAGLAAARATWLEAHRLGEALAEERAKLGEGDAALALEQEARVLQRLEAERATKHARGLGLDALVRAHGAEDLHERVQRAEADREEQRALLQATLARANAARELVAALHAARREVQQRLVAPVIERALPYLAMLFPGRRVRMDENWAVLGLQTGDMEEDLESLSTGAKEQVGVIVRLALAEVLGANEPLPIVLDDAFVNTDAARMGEMVRVLYRASRRQQILLFSCHAAAFERLGESKRYELARKR
jgi:energy-coupling factor transporter ATP-binding protein EcfA2